MSNQKRTNAARNTTLDKLMTMGQIDGGCSDCLAYQTVDRDRDGIYHVRIHHDDTCPWLSAREARLKAAE